MTQALYRFYDDGGHLLYVGITNNPARRFVQHAERKSWWRDVRGISIEWYDSRAEVESAERRAIAVEHPEHNVVRAAPRPAERRCGHCWNCTDGASEPCALFYPSPDEDALTCDTCGRTDCLYGLGVDYGDQRGFSVAYDRYARGVV